MLSLSLVMAMPVIRFGGKPVPSRLTLWPEP